MDPLIEQTAERIFADHVDKALLDAAEAGAGAAFPSDLWSVFTDAGLHLVGSPDSGSDLADLFGLLRVAGRHAVPLPLAEMLLAGGLIADLPAATGCVTVAFDGVAPWGRAASTCVTADGCLCLEFKTEPGSNLAGEPRDRITPTATSPIAVPDHLGDYLALARAASMAGAMERTMEMTVAYVGERKQFGRPLSKFQAVQHNLAVLAGEVAAAVRASDAAVESLGRGHDAGRAIAVAKARVGEAAGTVAEIAHQMHGAIGFTHEHSLHHFTRRLLAWRDEYGREQVWQERLGRMAVAGGADALWDFIGQS